MITEKKLITNDRLNESYIEAVHSSGLKIYISEKPEYSSAHAIFGTRYGSIDTKFRLKGNENFTDIPEGTAHFLEHKLFESEDGNAFERYAVTGAYANAYTSFDRTCYLFNCTSRFEENLSILLDFVRHPYFTAETVEKEQGIIGQEIRMYDDEAGWRVFFNLLCAMYSKHPVRIDIAGTTESIAEITADMLFECHKTFYNMSNMFICVAGKVNADEVLAQIDREITENEPREVIRGLHDEPRGINYPRAEQKLAVAKPLFNLGFKEECKNPEKTLKERIETAVLLEIIAGKSSALFERLVNEGLVNDGFGTEYFTGFGYAAEIFDGESSDPEKVAEEIKKEIRRLRENGIDENDFIGAKNSLYGQMVMQYNVIDNVVSALVSTAMTGDGMFDEMDVFEKLTLDDITNCLNRQLLEEHSALSVIYPAE
ncbi:MAG: insulinase family protein [Clostridia bacterium]|nr:insulinase family protein [Clostridia bacterium]MBQ5902606.1 insulinase family protein [Clostridia bacterium]